MSQTVVDPFGWYPYWVDHRDYSPQHAIVTSLLGKLKIRKRKSQNLPESVDWREYCGPVEDQQGLPTSPAHACVALIQQFERRASGRLLQLSRLFVHCTARRQLNVTGKSGVSLRAALKAIVRCGVPPKSSGPMTWRIWIVTLMPLPSALSENIVHFATCASTAVNWTESRFCVD